MYLAMLLTVLLILHGVAGAFMLFEVHTLVLKPLSYTLLGAFLLHALLGIIFTADACTSKLKGGKWYTGANAGYWVKRLTGIIMLVMVWIHMQTWTYTINGHVYLQNFTPLRFASQILFFTAIFLHLAVSIRPFLVKKGVMKFKERTIDILLVLTVFLVFFSAGLVAWFIRWNM